MKTLLLLITPAFLTAMPSAGQVITNIVPEAGDVAQIATNFDLSGPGESGTDVVWDFEAVSFGSSKEYFVVNASDAPGNEMFPEATHAIAYDIVDNFVMYNFYDFSEGEWSYHGYRDENTGYGLDGSSTINTGPRIPFNVPLSIGSSGASSYQSIYQLEDTEIISDWDYSWEVDASGTLILANATYSGVLRVKGVDVLADSIPTTVTEYIWVKDGIPFPLLTVSVSETDYGSGPQTSTRAKALISFTPTGLEDADRERFNTSVFPNPVGDALQFRTAEGFGSTASVTVIDALGRVVLQGGEMSTAAMETGTLDVQNLLPGLYILRVQGSGTVSETRFVKR